LSPQSELDPTGRSSGIFLFDGSFYEILLLLGILWTLIPMSVGLFMDIEFTFLEWFILSLFAGVVIQFVTFVLKLRRFRNPVTNAELLSLFEEVKTDIDKGQDIELWFRDIDRSVFLSTTNPLFKAILLSESTIADLLERPEKGKIVLAREVLMMERVSPISSFALGLLVFVFISLNEGSFFTFSFFSFFSIDMITLLLTVPFLAAIILMVAVPLRFAKSTQMIDKSLETIYGASPEAVKVEVLTGYKIPDEVIEKAKQDEEAGKPSPLKKMVTRSLIVFIIATPVSFVLQILFLPHMLEFIMFPLSFSVIIGFMAFILTFLAIPMFFMINAHRTRSTDWDFQHPFANDIQQFLGAYPEYQNLAVKAVKQQSNEMFGMVVERLRSDYSEETIYDISPHMLKDIQDVNLAGPMILSELRRKEIEKKYNRMSYSIIGITISIIIISTIWLFSTYSFELIITFLPVLIMCPILMIAPSIALSVWKRRAEIKSDVEIARKHPRFLESLQTLIDRHQTQPYGITSYKTRLERIKQRVSQ
jgi:hypothetical protein